MMSMGRRRVTASDCPTTGKVAVWTLAPGLAGGGRGGREAGKVPYLNLVNGTQMARLRLPGESLFSL